MARPIKRRRIENIPSVLHFVPKGQDPVQAKENVLQYEELEALRLKDLEGLDQEECAKRMAVSRPTFQRILSSAREKVADSLIHGKGIRIEGGNYMRAQCPVHCLDCGEVWDERIEQLENKESRVECPRCHSQRLECFLEGDYKSPCRGRGACRRFGSGAGRGHTP